LLGGAILVLDLRLLGFGLRDQSIARVARGTRPWVRAGVAVMLSTGFLLFLSEAVKCYHNPSFWVKMTTLPFALLFAFVIREPLAMRDTLVTSWSSRALGVVSMALWFTVAAGGRWIGFSS
jgi:hypothetical protein